MSSYFLNTFKHQGLDTNQIKSIIAQETPQALASYQALVSPLMSKDVYLEYWLEEVLAQTSAAMFVHDASSTSDYHDALVSVSRFVPDSSTLDQNTNLHGEYPTPAPTSTHPEAMRALGQVIRQRHLFAESQGYANYLELIIASEGIDLKACQSMEADIRLLVKRYKQELAAIDQTLSQQQSTNTPRCAVCATSFAWHYPLDETIDIAARLDPALVGIRDRIIIRGGRTNRTRYHKLTDTIDIELVETVSPKHQSLNLIHELGHASFIGRCFKNNSNPLSYPKYQHELAATAFEVDCIRSQDTDTYQAIIYDTLSLWIRLCVELAIYTNPNQDLEKVYGKCYADLSHSSIRPDSSFLLDPSFVYKPLSSLSYGLGLIASIKKNL